MTSTVTVTEVSRNFSTYQEAASREPVIITTDGMPRTVLMAYDDFLRLHRRERLAELTTMLSEADIRAVEDAEMEMGHENLNSEI